MNREIALNTLNQLVEQCVATGLFKRLADLDHVRSAVSFIQTDFATLEKLLFDANQAGSGHADRTGSPQ